MFRKSDTHIHFVGIGGIGMSGIAEVLLNLGYEVTGTDLRRSETTERLERLGATVHQGHGAQYLAEVDVVVISSAVKPDNPEVVAARERKIPVIPRAEMLAELMRLKQGIAIAGSHGKTTTTSLVAWALHEAGIDPTVVIGGKLNSFDSNARLGGSDVLVAEADESDGSFLLLPPTLGVITNIDAEHLDHYGDVDNLLDAFVGFANRVPFYGQAVVCTDDPNVRRILPRLTKRTVTYGLEGSPEYLASDVRHDGAFTLFRVRNNDEDLGEFSLRMPGAHNVRNALATIAVCDEQQIPVEVTRQALAAFSGVQRRFTVLGTGREVTVVDDYGHHPTEITATLAGARSAYKDRRVVAVMQPHRWSRLRDHLDGFAESMDDADMVVLTDVYAAGESPIPGLDVTDLQSRLQARKPDRTVIVERDLGRIPERLREDTRAGDIVITLGAGSITRTAREILAALEGP